MSDGVTYSIREILDRIERKVDHLADELDQNLREIRAQINELVGRIVSVESKVHEIDQYGSREMRDVRARLIKLEGTALTTEQVRAALEKRDNLGRAVGGHKLQIVGMLIAVAFLLIAIATAVNTLAGGH